MPKNDALARSLAVAGLALAWIPLLAPLAFGAARAASGRPFLVDWLMPAELAPLALAGGALLLWVAPRAGWRRAAFGWGLGLAVLLLAGSQALAVVTGLAGGATEPGGWQWALVVALLGGYVLALAAIGAAGILMVRDLF